VTRHLARLALTATVVLAAACTELPTNDRGGATRAGGVRMDGGPGTLGSGNVATPTLGGGDGNTSSVPALAPSTTIVAGDTATRGPGTLGSGN
jgi:hypothetical protein